MFKDVTELCLYVIQNSDRAFLVYFKVSLSVIICKNRSKWSGSGRNLQEKCAISLSLSADFLIKLHECNAENWYKFNVFERTLLCRIETQIPKASTVPFQFLFSCFEPFV